MVYGTAQNGYTLKNGPKCGLSTMKYILIKVGMYFIHRKLHTYTLHCHNTIFWWFWGYRRDELNRGCVLSMYSTRSITLVRETAEWSSGCVASFLLLSLTICLLHSSPSASLAHFNGPKVYFIYLSCQYNTFDALVAPKQLDTMDTGHV